MSRAVIAFGRSGGGPNAGIVAENLWPNDASTLAWFKQKTAQTPTATTTSGAPVATIVDALPPMLGPASAIGYIIKNCYGPLSFGNAAAISIPEIVASGAGVGFVAQGAPFPVRQLSISSTALVPKKLVLGAVMTSELYGGPNAETIIPNAIGLDLSLGLENLLLDATAADTTRPAGLINGLAAVVADAGTGIDAMTNDLANLATAVAGVGAMKIAFIASPEQYVKIQMRKPTNFPFEILCSGALASGQIAALALDAIAFAGDGQPRFELSKAATMVMQDSSPAAISVTGSPNVAAAPIRSALQADLVALRVIANVDWCLRSNAGFAWTENVNW